MMCGKDVLMCGKDNHWFQMIGVRDRVVIGDISSTQPSALVNDLQLHTFLPTVEDCLKLDDEFIVLVARVLTSRLTEWHCLQEYVPQHIPHRFSAEMESKSDIVSTLYLL